MLYCPLEGNFVGANSAFAGVERNKAKTVNTSDAVEFTPPGIIYNFICDVRRRSAGPWRGHVELLTASESSSVSFFYSAFKINKLIFLLFLHQPRGIRVGVP